MRQPTFRLVVHFVHRPSAGNTRFHLHAGRWALGSRCCTYKLVPAPSKIFSNNAKLALSYLSLWLKFEVAMSPVAFLVCGVLIVTP